MRWKDLLHLENLCSIDKCLTSFDHLVPILIGFSPDCGVVNITSPGAKSACKPSVEKRSSRDEMLYTYVLSLRPHSSSYSLLCHRGGKPENDIPLSLLSLGASCALPVGEPRTRLKGRVEARR